MKGTVILSHGLESGPQATKVSALAEVCDSLGWASVRPDYRAIDARRDPLAIGERTALALRHAPATGRVVFGGSSMMIAQLPADARRIVELGAGTGVFTRALLARGIAQRDLLVVELNEELHALLHREFPEARIVHGDARDLVEIAGRVGFAKQGGADAAISGLGFLAMPREVQKGILEAIFAVLGPGRPLIQFTYGPASPIPADLVRELGLGVRRAGIAPLNLPPAFVFVYTR